MPASIRFDFKVTTTEEDGEVKTFEEAAELPAWMVNSTKASDYVAMALAEMATKVADKM